MLYWYEAFVKESLFLSLGFVVIYNEKERVDYRNKGALYEMECAFGAYYSTPSWYD